jgi:hypothetical protein
MTPNYSAWMLFMRRPSFYGKYYGLFSLIFLLSLTTHAQEKCSACSIPSFAALTVYHTIQTGPGMGFGIEAGKWTKDAGKFSYFLGTEILWSANRERSLKGPDNNSKDQMISFYWKGQYKIANRFYLIVQPELANLSSFEMRTGIRYVMPLTKIIGIGLEPGYSFIEKQWSLNTNVHFALR